MGEGKIVSVHSYRGGTGKSNSTANLALSVFDHGKKVAVLDTDLQSPGVHVLFGFKQGEVGLTLVDFLWDKCSITETAYDVTDQVRKPDGGDGKLWLVPASMTTQAITRILDQGYDVNRLNSHFDDLLDELDLDYLFIDTHPGLNKETMLTSAISDVLVLLIRPDQQDYYGTAVLSEIAAKLEIPSVFLVVNKVFSQLDRTALKAKLEETFGFPVAGMIPLSEDLARLESRKLFVREYPDHEISHTWGEVADRIIEA